MHRVFKGVTIIAMAVCVVLEFSASASAQAPPPANPPQAPPPASSAPSEYIYTAQPGDTLTHLVRRSLQLEAENQKTTLPPAAALYCETTEVQKLGSYLLDVGQMVTIPAATLRQCITASKVLSAEQQAAWQPYVALVSFEIARIQPNNIGRVNSSAQTNQPSPPPAEDQNATKDKADEPSPQPPAPAQAAESAGWYWWLIGAGVLVALYFVLGGPTPRAHRKDK